MTSPLNSDRSAPGSNGPQSSIPDRALRKQGELLAPILETLQGAIRAGHPLDQFLKNLYRQHREFGARDRRLFSTLAFAYFRWRGWLEMNPLPPMTLGVIACLMDDLEWQPAIRRLAGQLSVPGDPLRPIGGLDLADKARAAGRWLGLAEPPLCERLVPAWVLPCLSIPAAGSVQEYRERYIRCFQSRPSTWIRICEHAAAQALTALRQASIVVSPHSRLPNAFRLEGPADLTRLPREVRSAIEIQDLGSQCAAWICEPKPGSAWWDLCAGSGGKSLHLAERMNRSGSILATDVRGHMLTTLQQRMRRAGLSNAHGAGCAVNVMRWNGEADATPDKPFDGVLVDAPCSGIGTWGRNPDARWRLAETDINRMAEIQGRLLRKAARTVRVGGVLVYSVCTLTRRETETVINEFLAEHHQFTLDAVPHPLTGETMEGPLWIWPWEHDCNGMFIARMRRS